MLKPATPFPQRSWFSFKASVPRPLLVGAACPERPSTSPLRGYAQDEQWHARSPYLYP